MFDDSIDFVMWGHEHDCRIQPEDVAGKRYRICQPGSSVATSLADGESIEKCVSTSFLACVRISSSELRHVALLEVHGKNHKLTPIPLRTVRPFVLDEVILSDAAEDQKFDLNDRMAISKFLRAKVCRNQILNYSLMILRCRMTTDQRADRESRSTMGRKK